MNSEEKYNKIYANNEYGVLNQQGISNLWGSSDDYFYKLAIRRSQILLKYYTGGKVLDVCSGNGAYMYLLSPNVDSITGVDFIKKACDDANNRFLDMGILNARCIYGNAKNLPFEESSFEMSYCFSALYDIPGFEKAIAEMRRVTKKDGIVVLDLGTNKSINTVISKHVIKMNGQPEQTLLSDDEIRRLLNEESLELIEKKCFQIFPYWGTHPSVLRFFCGRRLNHYMAKEVRGAMRDEIVSNLPIINRFAFRRIIVCKNVK